MNRPDPVALRAFLADLEVFMDAGDATEEHSVLEIDPATGGKAIIGPFPNRAAAEAAMRVLEVRWAANNEPPMGIFEVILSSAPDADLLAAGEEKA